MTLPEVYILVYAHRQDAPDHESYRRWLEAVISGPTSYSKADLVLSGFLGVVTHPRVFDPPSPLAEALAFAGEVRNQPHSVPINPGKRNWPLFEDLCRGVSARGNLIPDVYLAALAIESGSTWITTDRDFSRFPGLEWRHSLS